MKANASTHHIFGEPGPAVGSNIDANADLVQGGAEQVDPVPAANRLVSHAFLNGVDASPGCRVGSRQADTFCAVPITGIAFISDALERRTAIRASMAKAAVIHVPAMEKCGVGVGTGVAMWLEIDGIGIEVGVGDGREARRALWLTESLAMSLDEEECEGALDPHAASKAIKERHS